MIYNRLGGSGLKVSRFSIGSWVTFGGQVGRKRARKCLLAAYEHGVNFFDNAEAYAGGEAERVVGDVLKELRRESLIISSKVFWGGEGPNDTGLNRKHVTEACHAALQRLQVDYLDLYFCHRPDPSTPVEETVRAMDTLIQQGKVLYWGTSEWSAAQVREAYETARRYNLTPPTCEQPQYHMFHRDRVERELAPLYDEIGLGTTIWSPLSSGLLTGKYNDGVPEGSRIALPNLSWLKDMVITPERVEKVRQLTPIAGDLGCTMAQLALAWAAKYPGVSTVITGASRPEQVHENMKALAVLPRLTDEVMARIEAVLQNDPNAG
ncbi:MAG: aldo/keto reductase [Alphaproteobacteria bacterium]|nr:aldo/keto reductase [Alphaproteobacteria bacterium]